MFFFFFFQSVIGSLRHSLQERLGKISGKGRDEIYLKLRTSTGVSTSAVDFIYLTENSF